MRSRSSDATTARGASPKGLAPRAVCRRLLDEDAPGVLLFEGWRASSSSPPVSILLCCPRVLLFERDGAFIERDQDGERVISDPIAWMRQHHAPEPSSDPLLEALPFVGGLAGMLGFELAWSLDRVDAPRPSPRTPIVWVGDFRCAALFDHDLRTWSMVGDATDRGYAILSSAIEASAGACAGGRQRTQSFAAPPRMLRPERDAASAYRARVEDAIEAIVQRGDLFEVNYAERFTTSWSEDGFSLYEALAEVASGDFFGFLEGGEFSIASVSPERFLRVDSQGHVITRPIKGSMRRAEDADEDAALATQLLASEKDRAENIMIVDLMRNDLTRVCELGTVRASALCELESFAGIHHLVSTVEGELAHGFDALDALLASFPAGSITGAPKLRSIEYIAALEGSARGAYTGSLFFASDHGVLDSSVLIRTAELVDGEVRYGAGGAIVADSDPERERLEALLKLRPLMLALGVSQEREG